jgi:hypothetical protein
MNANKRSSKAFALGLSLARSIAGESGSVFSNVRSRLLVSSRLRTSTIILLATIATGIGGAVGSAKTSGPLQVNVDTIIIHAVSGPSCSGGRVVYSGAPGDAGRWKRFFDQHPFLGIHYIVDRAGTVLASTPENQVANHALGHNYRTIGIELVNDGNGVDPCTEKQIKH